MRDPNPQNFPPSGTECVYFVTDGSHIKIGYSTNLAKRFRDLQDGYPLALEGLGWLPGDRETEREMHRRFAHHRIRSEWFYRHEEIEEFIRETCPGRRFGPFVETRKFEDQALEYLAQLRLKAMGLAHER